MTDAQFKTACATAGFTTSQAQFLADHVAQKPHTHGPEEVLIDGSGTNLDEWSDGVEERLEKIEGDEDDDEDDETGEGYAEGPED